MPHHNGLHYPVSTPTTRCALRERMQSQSDFEEHPENEDVDIDEMLRNYRAKKKRRAKSTK
jgi:hypothetical protein